MVLARYQDRSEPARFAVSPDPARPRVIFLGGSSMHGGSKIATELEIPAVTQRLLAERGLEIEALNLGNPSLDSHHIRALALEALAFGPRLLVIYTGHNDLGNTLQEQRYGSFGGALTVRLRLLLWHSRAYLLLRDSLRPDGDGTISGQRPARPSQGTEPISDAQRLLAAEALQRNLEAVAREAEAQGAGLILLTPLSNWIMCQPIGRGCPEARAHIDLDAYGGRPLPPSASPALEQALAAHPDCAELLHARGRQRHVQGLAGAGEDLRRALSTDPSPMRATAAMTDAIRAAADSSSATLVDLEGLVMEQHGVPPTSWFVDCLHYTPQGHANVAGLLADTIEAEL